MMTMNDSVPTSDTLAVAHDLHERLGAMVEATGPTDMGAELRYLRELASIIIADLDPI